MAQLQRNRENWNILSLLTFELGKEAKKTWKKSSFLTFFVTGDHDTGFFWLGYVCMPWRAFICVCLLDRCPQTLVDKLISACGRQVPNLLTFLYFADPDNSWSNKYLQHMWREFWTEYMWWHTLKNRPNLGVKGSLSYILITNKEQINWIDGALLELTWYRT